MTKTTQVEEIVRYMRDNGSITSMEAFTEIGCTRLSARIADIKTLGYVVGSKRETRRNRYGRNVSYGRYWLEV